MPRFAGSMDEEKVKSTKPLLLPAMSKKKPPPPPSFLSEAQVLSLVAALLFACYYAGLAAYNLRDRDPCQELEPASSGLIRFYAVTGADNVDASHALLRGLMWCSTPQAAAAALALALLAGGRSRSRSRRGLGVRAAALVALAATVASHWMYLKMLALFRIHSPGDLIYLAVVAAAAFDLLGFMACVLGVDE